MPHHFLHETNISQGQSAHLATTKTCKDAPSAHVTPLTILGVLSTNQRSVEKLMWYNNPAAACHGVSPMPCCDKERPAKMKQTGHFYDKYFGILPA